MLQLAAESVVDLFEKLFAEVDLEVIAENGSSQHRRESH